MKRHIFALVVAVLFVVVPTKDIIRASTTSYTVEDLGVIDGLVPNVTGMNASGQVSGYVYAASGPRAVRFTGTQWEYVPGAAAYSLAMAINDNGDVAGYHFVPEGFRAFRYTRSSNVTTSIAPLTGGTFAVGFAINANGVVVGYGDSPSGMRGWRAAPAGPTVMLPTLGGTFSMACGINDNGEVVGSATTAAGHQHPFMVDPDNNVTEIVPFAGATGSGHACAVDASGRVGGYATSGSVNRAFVFDNGALLNVDTFGSTDSNVAAAAAGVSVGWYTVSNTVSAFVHTDDNGSVNLNDLITPGSGWQLDQAFAVNTAGWIAGNGRLNGQPRAFRLTPVAAPKDTTAPVISAVSATPSTVWPPNGALVPVTVSVTATDNTDPAPVCSLTSLTASGPTPDGSGITGSLSVTVRAVGGVTYTLTVTCTDAAGNSSSRSTDVVVPPDTTAPVISHVQATPDAIWPPNSKMVPVAVTVSATDDVDATPQCSLASISANGGSASDAEVTGPFTANVRSEKNSDGTVRVYTLHVKCADNAGNKSEGAATVVVGKDSEAVKAFLSGKAKKAR